MLASSARARSSATRSVGTCPEIGQGVGQGREVGRQGGGVGVAQRLLGRMLADRRQQAQAFGAGRDEAGPGEGGRGRRYRRWA